MTSVELKGNSGCKIYLIAQKSSRKFIRKISKNISYNIRLKKQENLLIKLKSMNFNSPKVLGSGYLDGKYFFDMSYISGQNFTDYILSQNLNDVFLTTHKILNKIYSLRNLEKEKINLVKLKLKLNKLSKNKSITKDNFLKAILKKLQNSNLQANFSPSHGDMTFENIIVNQNDIFFIDCLESEVSCWINDLAKLFQDPLFLWGYRDKDINRHIQFRTNFVLALLINSINKNLSDNEKLLLKNHILLNTLRIFPYIKNNKYKLLLKIGLIKFSKSEIFN